MPDVHAKLSASGAKRWMSCTPSANLEQLFPEETSEFAKEGTFAHAMAELMINRRIALSGDWAEYYESLDKMREDEYYSKELEDYIEAYVDTVQEIFNEAKAECELDYYAEIMTEQRLYFSEFVPDGFGTGDVVILSEDTVRVIDLKYGKGVPVSAVDNPQLKLYALGAISEYSTLYDFTKVKTTIIQPRLDSISTAEYTVNELLAWGIYTVKPLAEKALKGEGEYVAGDHCRFCKARRQCKARAEYYTSLKDKEFKSPDLLTSEELSEVLNIGEHLSSWLKDVQDFALKEALAGKAITGYKLVEGRSTRKYADEEKVVEALKKAGYDEDDLYEKKIKGVTAMQKITGKKAFDEILGGLVVRTDGKPTLVPESDKRHAIGSAASAAEDFKGVKL